MALILIIEDNLANLELMSYLLTAFGHTTLTKSDGVSGLALARSAFPQIIICDIQLPLMDGYEIASQLKADPATANIPLIAVTALAMVGDREYILQAGFDGYISKPIDPERLISQIDMFLPAHARSARPMQVCEEPSEETVNQEVQRRCASIVVVDDRQMNRELMRSILEPSGFEVRLAENVTQALLLIHERPPAIVCSDLHMPEQDGFSLIRAIRADPSLNSVAIIITSATVGSSSDHAYAMELGAQMFLSRPNEPETMLAAIESCLQSSMEKLDGHNLSA